MKAGLAVTALAILALSTSACSAVQGAQEDVERVQGISAACKDATVLGKDAVALGGAGVEGGLIALENGGAFIDAIIAMDLAKVDELSEEVAAGLPPADAKEFRKKLDQYGAASKKCRTEVKSA